MAHETRQPLAARFPVHVTIALREDLPSLRNRRARTVLRDAFGDGAERFGFRLVLGSIRPDGLHLIAEAKDRAALSRGLQGLFVRVARRLNRHWERKGPVFADRYHDRILRNRRAVREALAGLGSPGRPTRAGTALLFAGEARTGLLRSVHSVERLEGRKASG